MTVRLISMYSAMLLAACLVTSCAKGSTSNNQATSDGTLPTVQQGNMAHHGGTPTIRKAFIAPVDDPTTTNDESNDQPIGHFGTRTLIVHNVSSGNSYPLDADIESGQVERLYFPKGGWVDFDSGELDAQGRGSGIDEQGRDWEFEGYTDFAPTETADAGGQEQEDSDDD